MKRISKIDGAVPAAREIAALNPGDVPGYGRAAD